jgi:hypothetical protein
MGSRIGRFAQSLQKKHMTCAIFAVPRKYYKKLDIKGTLQAQNRSFIVLVIYTVSLS